MVVSDEQRRDTAVHKHPRTDLNVKKINEQPFYLSFAKPHGIQNLSSLTRDLEIEPSSLAMEIWSLIYWTAREVPHLIKATSSHIMHFI